MKFEYNCDPCHFHTNNKYAYSAHIQTKKHLTGGRKTKRKLYECRPCGYSSYVKCNFEKHLHSKKHLNRRSKKKPKEFVCKSCNYQTFIKGNYNKHLLSALHRNGGVKKNTCLYCDVCQQTFKTADACRVHKYRHQDGDLLYADALRAKAKAYFSNKEIEAIERFCTEHNVATAPNTIRKRIKQKQKELVVQRKIHIKHQKIYEKMKSLHAALKAGHKPEKTQSNGKLDPKQLEVLVEQFDKVQLRLEEMYENYNEEELEQNKEFLRLSALEDELHHRYNTHRRLTSQ